LGFLGGGFFNEEKKVEKKDKEKKRKKKRVKKNISIWRLKKAL